MRSVRTTKLCVVTKALLEQDGSYTLHLQDARNPTSALTKIVQKPNDITDHQCRAPLEFPGFPRGTRCLKGFASASQLKMHQRSVHELEPFACEHCTFITVDGSNFDKHARICKKQPNKPQGRMVCSRCGATNTRSDNHKRHEKTCKGKRERQEQEQEQEQVPSGYGPAEAAIPPLESQESCESLQQDLEGPWFAPTGPAALSYHATPAVATYVDHPNPDYVNYGVGFNTSSGLDSTLSQPATTFELTAPMSSNFIPASNCIPVLSTFSRNDDIGGSIIFDPALNAGSDVSAYNYLGQNSVSNPVFEQSFDMFHDPIDSTAPTENNLGGITNNGFETDIDTAIFGDLSNLDPSLAQELGLPTANAVTTGQTYNSFNDSVDSSPTLIDNQPLSADTAAANDPYPIIWDEWLTNGAPTSPGDLNDLNFGVATTPKDTGDQAPFMPMADFLLDHMNEDQQ